MNWREHEPDIYIFLAALLSALFILLITHL